MNSEQSIKNFEYWVAVLSALIVIAIFYLFSINQNQLLFFSGILILGLTIIVCSTEYLLFLLLFFISNQRLLVYQKGTKSILAVYIIFIFIKVIFNKNYIFDKKLLNSALILIIAMLVANLVNNAPLVSTDIIKTILNFFIFFLFLKKFEGDEAFFRQTLVWYVFGVIVSGVMGLLSVYSSGLQIESLRFATVNNDTNYFGVDVALAVSCSLVLYIHFQDHKYILISIFLFILGALSISRGYIVANLGNYYLFIKAIRKNKLRWQDFLFLSFLVLLLFVLSDYISVIMSRYMGRMRVTDISGGRIEIWLMYLKNLFSSTTNLLFGLGKWDRNFFYSRYGMTNVAHNFLIGAIATYGGLVVIMIVIHHIVLYNRTIEHEFHINFSIVIILTVLLGYSFLDGFLSNTFQYGFFIFLLAKNFIDKNERKNIYRQQLTGNHNRK